MMESDDEVTILEKIGEFPIYESARLLRALELRNIRFEIRRDSSTSDLAKDNSEGDHTRVQIYVRPEDADAFHAIYQSMFASADD